MPFTKNSAENLNYKVSYESEISCNAVNSKMITETLEESNNDIQRTEETDNYKWEGRVPLEPGTVLYNTEEETFIVDEIFASGGSCLAYYGRRIIKEFYPMTDKIKVDRKGNDLVFSNDNDSEYAKNQLQDNFKRGVTIASNFYEKIIG